MIGLEIVGVLGAVAAIVSAFRDGLEMIQTRRHRLADGGAARLEQSLTDGPVDVQREYNQNYARLGRMRERFQNGDGKCASNLCLTQISLELH